MRMFDREPIESANGVIMAGGKATRLGPLAAQISKALIPVGNRPQMINQIILLQEAGCQHVTVVASEYTYEQLRLVISRAGLDNFATVIKDDLSRGPVAGLKIALEHSSIDPDLPTYLLFADTVLNEALPKSANWVGVSFEFDKTRSWCYTRTGVNFWDGVPESNDTVTIGAYRFADTRNVYAAACNVLFHGYVGNQVIQMAPLLTEIATRGSLPFALQEFSTWQDVGDVLSLGTARRSRFTSRAHHSFVLDPYGLLHKTGVTTAEMDFYDSLGERGSDIQILFPTHYASDRVLMRYSMEYIDLPTLAELWLYWPGLPSTWAGIVQQIVDRLMHTLWQKTDSESNGTISAGDWMAIKARSRLSQWDKKEIDDKMLSTLADIVDDDVWVFGHGDLNFTNILYSLNTGMFKLIDPRGGAIPLIYEMAKLAYSHVFSSVTHGLFIKYEDGTFILPQRYDEVTAINSVLLKYVDEERLIAAIILILLAATPLHTSDEADVFYDLSMQMAKDLLS